MAAQSFHETKNFTCGEGGALLINEIRIQRAEIIREKGTNRSQFFRGQMDKYTWIDMGSSYLPSDMLAGFLYAQLEERLHIMEHRSENLEPLPGKVLGHWAAARGVCFPTVPSQCEQSYHMFYLLMPDLKTRQAFIEYMKREGVLCVFHYLPLHLSKMGAAYGAKAGDCPVCEEMSDRLVRLPFYNKLTVDEQDFIIEQIEAI